MRRGATEEIVASVRLRRRISRDGLAALLSLETEEEAACLYQAARETARRVYGNRIYIRGLIEFTNHCANNCYYCGIRKDNLRLERYRLSREEILDCCRNGYALGFRTFVLQGGEDPFFTDEKLCALVSEIKTRYPDCAVTLSVGEKSRESYARYFAAGADRYLLRHETADEAHYRMLHPPQLSLQNRKRCLRDLKEIGYQTGCGFLVGSPGQTIDTLYADLELIRQLRPHMVGIGPFLPQRDTPFADRPAGTAERTLRLLAILRLLHPSVLLPATTALATASPAGRLAGILAGANVVMPNLSPPRAREKYLLYDHKACSGDEAAEHLAHLKRQLAKIGYQAVEDRGDYRPEGEERQSDV